MNKQVNQQIQSKPKSIQVCLLLCVLVFATNLLLPISILGHSHLLFGSAFVFLAMLTLPAAYVATVALSVLITYFLQGQSWALSILFVVEVVIIYLLQRKEVFLLIASLLYWIVVGVPAYLLINQFASFQLEGESIIVSLQSAFNGILCAAIGFSIFAFIPNGLLNTKVSKQNRLSENIFALCASTLVVPLLIASLGFIAKQVEQQETATSDQLRSKSLFVGQITTGFLGQHERVVESMANLASITDNTQLLHQAMIDAQEKHTAFFNLTTVNKDGGLGFFAPEKYNEQIRQLPKELQSVQDRDYFNQAKQKQVSVISEPILSRGVVIEPMVAIAAPIIRDNNFDGIVYGALNLLSLNRFSSEITNAARDQIVVITDANKNIVFCSETTLYGALEPFVYSTQQSEIIASMPVLRLNSTDYLYQRINTEYGWQVYVLEKADAFSLNIRDQLLLLGAGLIIVFTVFLFFAYKLSNRITQPLVNLLQNEESFSVNDLEAKDISKEFSDVAKKLKRSSYLMKNFENRLKLQVEEKTEQLEQLNLQLAAQAREDGLTGLLNRGGFNELALNAIKTSYRLNQVFSIVLLDLDKFKNINDTYGHLVGDKCLIEFANVMQRFCKRETDIIGRYGGEEFVIFMSGGDVQSQHNIIDNIHQHTRFINIVDKDSADTINFTVSIGVCTVLNTIDLELRDLIQVADEELYKCKRNGRDKVSISTLGDLH